MRSTLFLLWIPQKWQLGFWSFVSCSQFAPAAAFMHLFPSLIVSLYLVVPGDFCPDTSTAAKDPSLSHYLSWKLSIPSLTIFYSLPWLMGGHTVSSSHRPTRDRYLSLHKQDVLILIKSGPPKYYSNNWRCWTELWDDAKKLIILLSNIIMLWLYIKMYLFFRDLSWVWVLQG